MFHKKRIWRKIPVHQLNISSISTLHGPGLDSRPNIVLVSPKSFNKGFFSGITFVAKIMTTHSKRELPPIRLPGGNVVESETDGTKSRKLNERDARESKVERDSWKDCEVEVRTCQTTTTQCPWIDYPCRIRLPRPSIWKFGRMTREWQPGLKRKVIRPGRVWYKIPRVIRRTSPFFQDAKIFSFVTSNVYEY